MSIKYEKGERYQRQLFLNSNLFYCVDSVHRIVSIDAHEEHNLRFVICYYYYLVMSFEWISKEFQLSLASPASLSCRRLVFLFFPSKMWYRKTDLSRCSIFNQGHHRVTTRAVYYPQPNPRMKLHSWNTSVPKHPWLWLTEPNLNPRQFKPLFPSVPFTLPQTHQ